MLKRGFSELECPLLVMQRAIREHLQLCHSHHVMYHKHMPAYSIKQSSGGLTCCHLLHLWDEIISILLFSLAGVSKQCVFFLFSLMIFFFFTWNKMYLLLVVIFMPLKGQHLWSWLCSLMPLLTCPNKDELVGRNIPMCVFPAICVHASKIRGGHYATDFCWTLKIHAFTYLNNSASSNKRASTDLWVPALISLSLFSVSNSKSDKLAMQSDNRANKRIRYLLHSLSHSYPVLVTQGDYTVDMPNMSKHLDSLCHFNSNLAFVFYKHTNLHFPN